MGISDLAFDWHPTWSPDGKKIAFVSERDGNKEIYVMNADGTHQINLNNNPCDDRDPDWCCNSSLTEESFPLAEYFFVLAIIIFEVMTKKISPI